MIGITSYGAHIPWYRIDRTVIYGAMGWLNPANFSAGEKAVASYDEDSLTMAVSAAMDCLKGIDRNTIDGVYFASVNGSGLETRHQNRRFHQYHESRDHCLDCCS